MITIERVDGGFIISGLDRSFTKICTTKMVVPNLSSLICIIEQYFKEVSE